MKTKFLYRGGVGEIVEKKSRFIAETAPVKSEEEAAAFHPLDQNRDGAVDGADLALSGMSREEFAAALVEQGLTGTLEEAEQVADGLLSVNYAVCNTVPERAQEICGYPPAESAAG